MQIIKVPLHTLDITRGTRQAQNLILETLKESIWTNESGKAIDYQALDLEEIHVNPEKQAEALELIEKNARKRLSEKTIFIGGDHAISYGVAKAFFQQKNSGMVVFDAHPDLFQGNADSVNHENWLLNLIKQGVDPKNIVLVGIRNPDIKELDIINSYKINTFGMKELFEDVQKATDSLMEYCRRFSSLYMSIDIDVADPAFAPGVVYPEPGGLSSRELLYMVQRLNLLKNLHFIDIVEVDPTRDPARATVKLAAKVLAELL